MSQATHVYRNKDNGKVGEMTEEQAAIWPDLLELVKDDAKPLAYMPIKTSSDPQSPEGDEDGTDAQTGDAAPSTDEKKD